MTANKKQNVASWKREDKNLFNLFLFCLLKLCSILVLDITESLYFSRLLHCQCFVSCLSVISNTASVWDTHEYSCCTHLSNHSNLQIGPWIMTALRLKLKFVVLTQKMNHGTCGEPRSSEQLSQQAGGWGWGQIRPCFHWGGGERRDLKTFHRMLFKQSVSNHGSKSNPCWENKLWYLTQKQRKGVFIEWLAWWVNSPAISSHSYVERSWLSLKWYLGSGIWNAPDWSRSRKLCLTWNRKSQ